MTNVSEKIRAPRHAPRGVWREAWWNVTGRVVYAGCQWFTLLAIARFGGTLAVGQFAFALAISAPIALFANLSLRQLQTTDTQAAFHYDDYIVVRRYTTLLATASICGLSFLVETTSTARAVICLVALAKASESQSDIIHGFQQLHRQLDMTAKSLVLRGTTGTLALALTYAVTSNIVPAIAVWTSVWVAVYVLYDVRNQRHLLTHLRKIGTIDPTALLDPLNRKRRQIRLVLMALPMGFVALAISLNGNVSRYFIENILGLEALGRYAAMNQFVVVGTLIISSIGQATLVQLATYWSNGNRADFARLVGKMLLVSGVAGCSGIVLAFFYGKEILTIAYGSDFASEDSSFVWIMIAGAVGYLTSPLFFALSAQRIFKQQILVYVFALAVNTCACALLIPHFGLLGAAWALLLSLLAQTASSALLSRKVYDYRLNMQPRRVCNDEN